MYRRILGTKILQYTYTKYSFGSNFWNNEEINKNAITIVKITVFFYIFDLEVVIRFTNILCGK